MKNNSITYKQIKPISEIIKPIKTIEQKKKISNNISDHSSKIRIISNHSNHNDEHKINSDGLNQSDLHELLIEALDVIKKLKDKHQTALIDLKQKDIQINILEQELNDKVSIIKDLKSKQIDKNILNDLKYNKKLVDDDSFFQTIKKQVEQENKQFLNDYQTQYKKQIISKYKI